MEPTQELRQSRLIGRRRSGPVVGFVVGLRHVDLRPTRVFLAAEGGEDADLRLIGSRREDEGFREGPHTSGRVIWIFVQLLHSRPNTLLVTAGPTPLFWLLKVNFSTPRHSRSFARLLHSSLAEARVPHPSLVSRRPSSCYSRSVLAIPVRGTSRSPWRTTTQHPPSADACGPRRWDHWGCYTYWRERAVSGTNAALFDDSYDPAPCLHPAAAAPRRAARPATELPMLLRLSSRIIRTS